MDILRAKEYEKRKIEFINKHGGLFEVETSPMDADGKYMKTYYCEDGAHYVEINRPIHETATAEVRGCEIKVTVKLFETESLNTDDAHSVYTYEQF